MKSDALLIEKWCPRAESNHRHEDFQSSALPTELPGHIYADKVFYNLIQLNIDIFSQNLN